jgi:hypothetical protein
MLHVQSNVWLTLIWQLWEAALDGICIGIESVKAALACCVVAALHCAIECDIVRRRRSTANPSCQLMKEEEEAHQN